MAELKSVVAITNLEDDSIHHYDVNYEGFVVSIRPDEVPESPTRDQIIAASAAKVAEIEATEPEFGSQVL